MPGKSSIAASLVSASCPNVAETRSSVSLNPGLGDPAKAELLDRRRQRADGEARLGRLLGVVVAGGRDVVGRVGMEDRGQVLDLAASLAQLQLSPAVGPDPLLLAVVVGGEEVADRPEPRGLEVNRPWRRPWHRLD